MLSKQISLLSLICFYFCYPLFVAQVSHCASCSQVVSSLSSGAVSSQVQIVSSSEILIAREAALGQAIKREDGNMLSRSIIKRALVVQEVTGLLADLMGIMFGYENPAPEKFQQRVVHRVTLATFGRNCSDPLSYVREYEELFLNRHVIRPSRCHIMQQQAEDNLRAEKGLPVQSPEEKTERRIELAVQAKEDLRQKRLAAQRM